MKIYFLSKIFWKALERPFKWHIGKLCSISRKKWHWKTKKLNLLSNNRWFAPLWKLSYDHWGTMFWDSSTNPSAIWIVRLSNVNSDCLTWHPCRCATQFLLSSLIHCWQVTCNYFPQTTTIKTHTFEISWRIDIQLFLGFSNRVYILKLIMFLW